MAKVTSGITSERLQVARRVLAHNRELALQVLRGKDGEGGANESSSTA